MKKTIASKAKAATSKAATPKRSASAAKAVKSTRSTRPAASAKSASKPAKALKRVKAAAPVKTSKAAKPARPAPSPTRANRKTTRPVTQAAAPRIEPAPSRLGTSTPPKKNQAGLGRRELEYFHNLLLEKRRELVGDMSSMEREALRSSGSSNLSNLPVHMADMGTDNYEQEFTLGLVEKDRTLLREINQALAKIQDGTYGICEGTGKPIGKPRLEAKPWARYSIEYARQMEQGRLR